MADRTGLPIQPNTAPNTPLTADAHHVIAETRRALNAGEHEPTIAAAERVAREASRAQGELRAATLHAAVREHERDEARATARTLGNDLVDRTKERDRAEDEVERLRVVLRALDRGDLVEASEKRFTPVVPPKRGPRPAMPEQVAADGPTTCPECGTDGEYVNVGPHHHGICADCRCRWPIGENLFSSWNQESAVDWLVNAERLLTLREADLGVSGVGRLPPIGRLRALVLALPEDRAPGRAHVRQLCQAVDALGTDTRGRTIITEDRPGPRSGYGLEQRVREQLHHTRQALDDLFACVHHDVPDLGETGEQLQHLVAEASRALGLLARTLDGQ